MIKFGHHIGSPTEDLLREVASLSDQIFDSPNIDYTWRLKNMPHVSIFYAEHESLLVGFKAGYAIAENKYYSWLGGVHPDFRNKGMANHLTTMQHQWLVLNGYSSVETSCRQGNSAMARINLRNGFSVVGTKLEPHALQVLWSKPLA
jgi:ribosomal protein S18 acetylase RimI-like enzyme